MKFTPAPTNPFARSVAEASKGSINPEILCAASLRDSGILVFPRDAAEMRVPDEAREISKMFGRGGGEQSAYAVLGDGTLGPADIALLAADRQSRVDFFRTLEGTSDKTKAIKALHSIIAADGPDSYWFVRKLAFEYLRQWSAAPLSASLSALASTKDAALKAVIMSVVANDLSFPISSSARKEVQGIRALGGELCNTLLADAPTTGERPSWVSAFPRFVRGWISACGAVGVDHGVDAEALQRFSRNAGGPLNEWHIRTALEPLNPLSWGGIQAMIRRVTRL